MYMREPKTLDRLSIIDSECLFRAYNAALYQVERRDAAKLLVPAKLPNWDEPEYREMAYAAKSHAVQDRF